MYFVRGSEIRKEENIERAFLDLGGWGVTCVEIAWGRNQDMRKKKTEAAEVGTE